MRLLRSTRVALVLAVLFPGCHSRPPATASAPEALKRVVLSPHDTIEAGYLHGQVQSKYSDDSIAEAFVSIDEGKFLTRTNVNGRFGFHGVAPGWHRVEVRMMGWWPTRGSILMPKAGGGAVRVLMETPHNCLDFCEIKVKPAYGSVQNVP